MAKPELNEDQYIAEANRRLLAHAEYHPGLAFLAHPEGATGGDVMGIAMVGFPNRAYIDVSNSMQAEFDLLATPRPYRGFQQEVK